MNFITNHLGEIAGIISFFAYLKYIISTFQGKTKPSRSTWWILTFVGVLIFASSYTLGARENVWIQLSYVLGPLIIAIQSLSVKYGYGLGLLKIDKVCISGAILCIILWVVFNSALVAFIGSIVVDFIGLIPTIKKAYADPHQEDPTAWGMEMTAIVINAFAISAWFSFEDKSWIYALYLLFSNALITLLLVIPRKIKLD